MQFAIKQYDLTFIITKLIVVMMSTVLISMLTWIHGTSVKGNIILWLEIDVSASADRYSQILQESTNHPIFFQSETGNYWHNWPNWPRGWNLFYQSEWFKWGALKLESQCVISGYTKLSSNCCQNVVKLWTQLSQKCHINNFDHHPTMTNMNIDPALLQPPGVRTFSTTSIFSPPPCTRFQFNFLLV